MGHIKEIFTIACISIIIHGIFSSCSSNFTDIPTYHVKKTDFTHSVTVPGVLEAKSITSISCPRIRTDATVVYLIPEGTKVSKGDTVCILDAPSITTKYLDALNNYEYAKAEYNKSLVNLDLKYTLLEAQTKLLEQSTAIKQLDSARMKFVSDTEKRIIDLELKKAALKKEKIQKKLFYLKKINDFELHKKEMKIKQYENRLERAKSKLNKLTIVSQTQGIVMFSKLWTSGEKIREGDIVWDWMKMMQIPDMSGMKVVLQVNETHYKLIKKGQKLHINIDANPEIELTGMITKKAKIGKPIKRKSKVKAYEIVAEIDSSEFMITPGLTVTCKVFIADTSDILVAPVISLFEYDSNKIVYVSKKGKFVRQTIETLQQSNTEAIISEGLIGNEKIALAEPPLNLIVEPEIEKN